MSGAAITVTIDDADLVEQMQRKLDRLDNLRPLHAQIGEHMLNSIEDRFDSETAPDGAAWTPLAPATTRARLARNGNAPLTILRERGRLAGSFNYTASPTEVRIGTNVTYAAIHHFGGAAGRGRKVTIPARPILGLSDTDRSAISDITADFLSE
ncbi:hypothetical protein AN189_02910 [Loktanella sp. 3ANDIMAR09]|uniref:phage virion morphogenesis protein n=1 Tax=Loktanella sp. 3ANDIMAR09 TaxID=1225657 RepID=UPI0006F67382|nr:phage virion morphogenesis protein [Loktanella sp. 3ANDIMAR09]KQI69391.1 hypothetical protein AN189_02910 [Loktanella sp. 3ANDIMAR09]